MSSDPRKHVTALGESAFNYALESYGPERFLHYYQQLTHVLPLRPTRVLEVGPGDHTVTDFLRRKGISVHTFDFDAALRPDFYGDIREPLKVDGPYDVVLASEVLEHAPFRWLDTTVRNLAAVVRPGGHLVISLPYSTVRLFPPDGRYGRVFSSAGRLRTKIELRRVMPLLRVARKLYKIAKRAPLSEINQHYGIPKDLREDDYESHHWDVGIGEATRSVVRDQLARHGEIEMERTYDDTNAIFYVLRIGSATPLFGMTTGSGSGTM